MLLAPQIAAIIMLLTAFGVDPITTADVQRILEGRPAITSTATTTTMTSAQPPAPAPTSAGVGAAPDETTQPTVAPASQSRIDIINYRPGSGLNRPHSTSPELDNDGKGNPKNGLDIGAVVYGEDGEPTRSATVVVSVTTPDGQTRQDAAYGGTGGVTPIYERGQKRVVPVYAFHYDFKEVGEHTITFSSNGISQSVTVTVSE